MDAFHDNWKRPHLGLLATRQVPQSVLHGVPAVLRAQQNRNRIAIAASQAWWLRLVAMWLTRW